MSTTRRRSQRGQVMVLFALALTVLVLGAAVVVDGGYAFAQRRQAQNAADFAAMAGTRIIGVGLTGQPPGAGTALNVENAVKSVLAANDAELIGAQYVDEAGISLGNVVGASTIPRGANGVVVDAKTSWKPFLLGVIGVDGWEASSTATAITPGSDRGGGVMPVGIQDSMFDDLPLCPLETLNDCSSNLTPGVHNIPGGFGWLSFGIEGKGQKCGWSNSLGMVAEQDGEASCGQSNPFLNTQIGPPAKDFGCCTEVGLDGSVDLIASFTGNTWGDLSVYVQEQIPVWVPIWDTATDEGSHGYYHIVGFGPIIFTEQDTQHGKWLTGAAIDVDCGEEYTVPVADDEEPHKYCSAPLDAFLIDVSGGVQLVN